jgi:cell division protein FtsQ
MAKAHAIPTDVRLMRVTANLLLAGAVITSLVGGMVWLARQPVFVIRGIRLDGDLARSNVSAVRANAASQLAGTFFTLDLQRARAAFESVPWVRRASVSRLWPNRIAVHLEEHRPVAVWATAEGNDRLVNAQGEVFDANLGDVEDAGLVTFSGPEGSASQMLAMYVRLSPLLARLQGEIATLKLSRRGSWRVVLDTGQVIELGRGADDEVLARCERFVRTVAQVTGRYQRKLEYADLRHADGYAVRMTGITTVSQAPPLASK